MVDDMEAAVAAVRTGGLVVYPTETVYGLGGDATEPAAIERVFAAKDRPRDRPLSLAVPTVSAADEFVRTGERTRAFMAAFLPGPVTVVCPKAAKVPASLTAGRDRVGVRVPANPVATSLLERVAPLTATSANLSGSPAVREPGELTPAIRRAVDLVLDDGPTPGGASTVVDPDRGVIHRRGRQADAVETWLVEHES